MDDIEKQILNLLTFPESFQSIREEMDASIPTPVIADALKNLIHLKCILPLMNQNEEWVSGSLYDTDNMQQFMFKATNKGLDFLTKHSS